MVSAVQNLVYFPPSFLLFIPIDFFFFSKEVKSFSCCLWSNHLPLKFADYFDFVFIELTSLLASQIVRGEHLTLLKFSLNMVTLKATHSSLRRNFQRLILLVLWLIRLIPGRNFPFLFWFTPEKALGSPHYLV